MSRKYNGRRKGKKARGYGSARGGGMSKHRKSGHGGTNRNILMARASDTNRATEERRRKRRRLRETSDTVRGLFDRRRR